MENKIFKRTFIGVLVIVIFSFLAFTNPGERYFEIAKNLDIFATLFKEVNTYYVDEVNPNELMKTGINAMLMSLDPYTNYIPEDDIEDYRTMTTGQYGGIGALIGQKNGKNVIIMPYEGFPAFRSGLKIGDEILSIDGVDVRTRSTNEVSRLLKGQANTEMSLELKRYGMDETLSIKLVRERITINNVPYFGMLTDKIGYIKLSDFTTGASKEVRTALHNLKSKGADKIVFDLRDNPGGLLSEAVNVSNIFIPRGYEVVHTKGKVSDWNKQYKALDQPADIDIPVVVLTSGRSASAAEIVAGVIQDYDRGVLVGSRTFGKGLVQATRPLTYNSQLKVTTAKYYIPSGRCIQSIDYSLKAPDGSIIRVPDSLQSEFKTANGRSVYDGGGITPDIDVAPFNYAPITTSLVAKGLIFDYATVYSHKHPQIADPKDFRISDSEYNEFVKWLADKDYNYVTKVEKTLDELVENSKEEKYFSQIEDKIMALKKQVHHNKENDLVNFKEEIKQLLNEEIVSRYYFRNGMIEASFNHDPVILEAINTLSNKDSYMGLLSRR
jgi:carboxyl-terminal processing protease